MSEKVDQQGPQVRAESHTNTVEATPWSIKLETADPGVYNQKQAEIDKEFIAKNYKANGNSGLTDNLDKTLCDFDFIIKDVLAGDPKALERPEFTCLNFDAIKAALQWLNEQNEFDNSTKADLFSNAWRLNFKCKPPTPEEFLTEKYIGPMAESLRPGLRDTFIEAFDPLKPYRTIVLTPHIGWGKSTWSVLANLFVSTHFAMMWHPYKYFNLAVSTMFTQVLGAWNMKKASELLLEPFMQILEASPYFKRVRTHTDLMEANGNDLVSSLHWTTSTPTAQPLDSKIVMADGSVKTMGEIEIGDKLKSPSEGTTEVISIPYHGTADCYEIELEDGRTVRCSPQHLWNVRRTPEADWEVVNLQYILDHPEFDWEIRELSDF